MYIKKSRLVTGTIIIVLVTAILTAGLVNPFGFLNLPQLIKVNVISKVIDNFYYEDIDKNEAANMAIAGIAASTGDPYTRYLWGDTAKEYMEEVEGNYCGVGLYIENDTKENLISVVSAIAGSPAESAGITTNDKILAIDGQGYTGEQLSEAASYMRGEEGTEVTLRIRTAADGQTKDVKLTRGRIEIESVSGEMLDNNIGYISITQFTEGVAQKVEQKCREFKNMKGLIIDLRNNPCGILDEGVNTAGLFLNNGDVVTYTMNKRGKREDYKVDKGETGRTYDVPIVILVNGGSASASEVMTGALSSYKKAVVIGEKSYGKGIVQSVMGMGSDGILSVTIARYYTPDGVCIHGTGIEPDIKVEMSAEKTARLSALDKSQDEQLKAAVDYLNK